MLFPPQGVPGARTRLLLDGDGDALPHVLWAGLADADDAPPDGPTRLPAGPGSPLLGEHAHGRFTRPHLRGHRTGVPDGSTGRSWTTRFRVRSVTSTEASLRIEADDREAGLALVTEAEALEGGSLRVRHTVTNAGAGRYVVDGLEVAVPVDDRLTEVLDFTGRHEGERSPQRHALTDGLYLREARGGRPGLDAPTAVVVGTPGFTFEDGRVLAVHVAWSGNSVLRVERNAATGATVGGGELLLPGEVALAAGESYSTPWVVLTAADDGLDGVSASWHAYQRSWAAHPAHQPVVVNVWEAVLFDHDLERLRGIADRAAQVGVERFVLDDGWFRHRRDDTAGLGDWWVDETVWPDGLDPLIDHVRGLGMEFGLWFEPEMVNPDSDLFRAHPEWVLAPPGRLPLEHRHQQVLDLTRPEVVDHLFERVDAILGAHRIDYVKWDHNRELLEAASGARGGAPAVHDQTLAFYELLDRLRAAHPSVAWESCASGGGRIDLGVLERVQRVWTSDMTDALSRQQIQRWTSLLVAPEYLGAHVAAPTSPISGRTFTLDFRAGTALFGAFGIEWDLTRASDADLEGLADWVARHRRFRALLHSGRTVRPTSSDPAVQLHGVVAQDHSEALVAHVQLDESAHNRGVSVRVPGLDPSRHYALAWEGPHDRSHVSMSAPLRETGPTGGVPMTGAALARHGFWMPRRHPQTVTLVHVTAAPDPGPGATGRDAVPQD
jgi:alpha-galactosidase